MSRQVTHPAREIAGSSATDTEESLVLAASERLSDTRIRRADVLFVCCTGTKAPGKGQLFRPTHEHEKPPNSQRYQHGSPRVHSREEARQPQLIPEYWYKRILHAQKWWWNGLSVSQLWSQGTANESL